MTVIASNSNITSITTHNNTNSAYHQYETSVYARDCALSFIRETGMKDTGQLGFWCGIPLASDYAVIAILFDHDMRLGTIKENSEFLEYLNTQVPSGFYDYIDVNSLMF